MPAPGMSVVWRGCRTWAEWIWSIILSIWHMCVTTHFLKSVLLFCILQVKELRFREEIVFTQCHRASKWWKWNRNTCHSDTEVHILWTELICHSPFPYQGYFRYRSPFDLRMLEGLDARVTRPWFYTLVCRWVE